MATQGSLCAHMDFQSPLHRPLASKQYLSKRNFKAPQVLDWPQMITDPGKP